MMNVLSIHNLYKTYGERSVLNGLTFSVQAGEIFCLLGQNGAGKTTTLSIIEGLISEYQGDVTVFDKDVKFHTRDIRRKMGVQLQSTALLMDLSVFEQVKMFSRLYQLRMTTRQIHDLLEQFQLADKMKKLPAKLSGGEKQRLTLALALVNQPDLLILDEPTAGLDVQSRKALWEIIQTWKTPQRAVILTTHYIQEAEKLADRVGILHEGVLVALDSPRALVTQLDLLAQITFNGDMPTPLRDYVTTAEKIHIENGQTKIYTRHINRTNMELMSGADNLGIELHNMHIQYPSLEDVFLSVTGSVMSEMTA